MTAKGACKAGWKAAGVIQRAWRAHAELMNEHQVSFTRPIPRTRKIDEIEAVDEDVRYLASLSET